MGFLAGKRLLITGILSNRSIAYGIARACHREGAELALSYQGERFRQRIAEFAEEFGSKLIFDSWINALIPTFLLSANLMRPNFAMIRFSPIKGMTSAIVPSAARSRNPR